MKKTIHTELIRALKNILLPYFIIIILITLPGCNKDSIPVTPLEENSFAIYFLKDSTLKIKDIYNKDLNSLQLAEKPWISTDDFYMYDFSSQCIYLKGSKKDFLLNYDTVYIPPPSWSEKPFVVSVNKRACYAGYISNPLLSTFRWQVSDIPVDIGFYPEDIFNISWMFLFSQDIRNNDSVKKILQSKSLYHDGINIEFDSISVFNGDTASIRYSIWIKNNDIDNLYVLDPEKSGDSVFNIYQTSPVFKNTETQKVYYADTYNPNMGLWYFYNWKPEWFTLLGPGETINRKVFLKAYDKFGDGNYIFQMEFWSPRAIPKEKRYSGNGRYWIGKSRSDVYSFEYKNNEVVTRLNNSHYVFERNIPLNPPSKGEFKKLLQRIILPLKGD